MPGVGSHPGTPLLFMMVGTGFFAGLIGDHGSITKALGASAVTLFFIGGCYLCGAVGRARLSDRITKQKDSAE